MGKNKELFHSLIFAMSFGILMQQLYRRIRLSATKRIALAHSNVLDV